MQSKDHSDTVAVDKVEENTYKDVFDDVEGKLKRVKDWGIPCPMTALESEAVEGLMQRYAANIRKTMSDKEAVEAIKVFANRIKVTYTGHWMNKEYDRIFKDNDELTQSVKSEKGPIRIQGQSIGSPGSTLTGPTALMALQSAMGVGRPTKIPLWHSGIVLTVSNFKESEILGLSHSLNEQRIELGYATQGFLFSGSDVNLVMTIVDFILDHAIACNLNGWMQGDRSVLKSLILVSDIPALLAGGLDSMYPSGYPSERHCKNTGTEKCDYVSPLELDVSNYTFKVDSLLRFGRTLWVDNSRIPLSARQHMSAPTGAHEESHIREYQETFNTVNSLTDPIPMGDVDIQIALRQPNLSTYEEAGNLWITGVLDMVDGAMAKFNESGREVRAKKRREYIAQYEYVLRFQKHAAWVSSIQWGEDLSESPSIANDPKTIFDLMEGLTSDSTMVKIATDAINRYREDTQVTFTGITNFKCPVCGESQVEGTQLKHGIIPMDMVGYFFMLMGYLSMRLTSAQMEN